jgi:hypothetical protein
MEAVVLNIGQSGCDIELSLGWPTQARLWFEWVSGTLPAGASIATSHPSCPEDLECKLSKFPASETRKGWASLREIPAQAGLERGTPEYFIAGKLRVGWITVLSACAPAAWLSSRTRRPSHT